MAKKKAPRRRTSGQDFISEELRRRAADDPVAWMAGIVPVVGPLARKM